MESQKMCAWNIVNGQSTTPHLNNVPLISIVILCYNSELKNLFSTLTTIFSQNYPNIELIISDDGSEKFNLEEIEQFVLKQKRVNLVNYRIITNKVNKGTVAHANYIGRICKGEYIKFLSPGDGFYNIDSLNNLLKFAQRYKESIVSSVCVVSDESFTKAYYTYPNKRRLKILNNNNPLSLFKILAFSNIISAVGTMFSKDFFLEEGFDETYKYLEDYPLWLKLSRNGIRIPYSEKITTYYGIGGNSSKYGSAFESRILREDLIMCFEKEILPYKERIGFIQRYFLIYQYKKIKFYINYSWIQRRYFQIKFLPFELYKWIKKIVKKVVLVK